MAHAGADRSAELPFQLQFSLTPEERKESQQLEFTGADALVLKRSLAINAMVLLVMLALAFGGLLLGFEPGQRLPVAVGLGVLGVAAFTFAQLRKRHQDDEPANLEVSADGLRFGEGVSSYTVPAASVERLFESENLFGVRANNLLFALPKRAFASDRRRDCFRALTSAWTQTEQAPSEGDNEPAETSAEAVTVEFRLKFLDYIDRTLMSWRSRVILSVILSVICGACVMAAIEPAPGAVFSNAEVFVYFVLPFAVVVSILVLMAGSVADWNSERAQRCDTRMTWSDRGIKRVTATEEVMLDWSQQPRFKESPWVFYVWWVGTGVWFSVPKRAFASESEIQLTRSLLATHAEESTWFWG